MVRGWTSKPIKELANIISGGTPSTQVSDYWNGNIIWISPTDITGQKKKYLVSSDRKITEKGLANSAAVLLPTGTILLCTRATIGDLAIAAQPTATNQGFKNLICFEEVDNEWLYYAIQPMKQKMIEQASGSTFLEISKTTLGNIEILTPSCVNEQRTIASSLSDVDGYIDALELLIDKMHNIKKGAMQELLTGKRRLPGFDGEWVEGTLGDCLIEIVGGGTPSRGIPSYWNGGIPWVTVKDFATFTPTSTQEYISEFGLINSATHLIPKGTLIAATRMGLGRIVTYEVDVTINQDLKALFVADNIDRDFIKYWFILKANFIEDLGTGSTVKGIRVEQLEEICITLPPTRSEQSAIATILSDMDSEIDTLTAKLDKIRNIKQGMMQELLTGHIRLMNEK